ncbi:PD-(D/E)XK nuclease family protein [uncultured Jannaschia sp.]|uniref:PD-(D/E)XK nuclease family protein n=1 Tax=uncultured Jannaschia sp. TaxID=293347 RepID=UPI0026220678|nr:PD-(D/E)XK nuclease family protein [uncultured Jannaschia sp.]
MNRTPISGLHHEPPGVDFSRMVVAGLRQRLGDAPPEALARVTIVVNTSRMARRIEAALAETGATLLPRIGLVSDLAPLLPPGRAPQPEIGGLALRLRLTTLVDAALRRSPDLSPPAAAFDLASSLATLLGEMQEEGMDPAAFEAIDAGDLSDHWARNLEFLRIVADWQTRDGSLTEAGAQAVALDRLLDHWRGEPPADPVIVAGSTASRTPTRRLIRAVLDLPQGAVILPGLDGAMPDPAWAALTAEAPGEQDHPQYRHAALLAELGLARGDVPRWGDADPVAPARNALLSLALRPAPATDAWRTEGPELAGLAEACAGITLLEAPSPAAEAAAIALGLRGAVAEGRRAALITPDRVLSRQVAAQLDRWGIEADDSAGRPLNQSAPGRLLLHVAEMRGRPVEAEDLAILLKHPLTATGSDRLEHLAHARRLELELLRRDQTAFPDAAALAAWSGAPEAWRAWLGGLLDDLAAPMGGGDLSDHARRHRALVERVGAGPGGAPGGAIWDGTAGRLARRVVDTLAEAAPERGPAPVPAADHARILGTLLAAEEVRESYAPRPDVMIWGALEARVRTAELVILGGLNDGTWPDSPGVDPWLNRAMRRQAGLRLPERTVGLSAHDFQQAAAGPEIWLSRAVRDAETDTVPSRWLNRLTGLLAGIGPEAGTALEAMRRRGTDWLAQAAGLETPDHRHAAAPAPRPAPKPPIRVRPTELGVTAIETLIRDPYAIYARRVLRLRPLDPLRLGPDARVRGRAVHDAMEAFSRAYPDALPPEADARLHGMLTTSLEEAAPWPGARRLWLGKFARVLPDLLAAEAARRIEGRPTALEEQGRLVLTEPPFTLTARADRMDLRGDAVAIYDYKTGPAPSEKQQKVFAKQLLLEAMMVQRGAFPDLTQRRVDEVAYLSIGSVYKAQPVSTEDDLLEATYHELADLLLRYAEGQPYIARLAPDFMTYAGDYDHLSRFGEWDDTVPATVIPVGRP